MVEEQGRFVINVPDEWGRQNKLQNGGVDRSQYLKEDDALSAANGPLFEVIYVGAYELWKFWASGSMGPVRSLGYAFHVLPGLLRTPDRFSPELYLFNFRIVSFYWNILSPELRAALCKLQGLDAREAARLIQSDGFAINLWNPSD